MKIFPTLLLIIYTLHSHAQSNTFTVSMNGIGDIKIGMKKAELEKLLGQPVKIVHLTKKDDYNWDTVKCTYKGLNAEVILANEYVDENKNNIVVQEINSSHPQLKTPSGIGIGDDKFKILSTYDGYMIYIIPEYENNYTVKSKTKSSVWVHSDDAGKVIVFHLVNNKVTSMTVGYQMGD